MIRFIVIIQLKAQRSDGCVVREQRLLRYDPDVARIRHVIHRSVPKYCKGIVLAVRGERDAKRETCSVSECYIESYKVFFFVVVVVWRHDDICEYTKRNVEPQ
jgi:hypothetical protein